MHTNVHTIEWAKLHKNTCGTASYRALVTAVQHLVACDRGILSFPYALSGCIHSMHSCFHTQRKLFMLSRWIHSNMAFAASSIAASMFWGCFSEGPNRALQHAPFGK